MPVISLIMISDIAPQRVAQNAKEHQHYTLTNIQKMV